MEKEYKVEFSSCLRDQNLYYRGEREGEFRLLGTDGKVVIRDGLDLKAVSVNTENREKEKDGLFRVQVLNKEEERVVNQLRGQTGEIRVYREG